MTLGTIKNSEKGKNIIFSDSLSSLRAIQEGNQNHSYIREIQDRYQYLTHYGKTLVLAWAPSHMGIRENQMADTLAKEATKMMITTLKLPFTDYKNIRRKWPTIWDMFLNKLYKHQPTIKLEITELLPHRRQDIILCWIKIGHTYLTHAYLLKGETAPWCTCCNQLLTVTYWLTAKNIKTFARKTTTQQSSPWYSKMYLPLK